MYERQQHPAIEAWIRKNYTVPADGEVYLEQEERSGGYCDTCYYEYEVWVIYHIKDGKRTQIAEFSDDLASILNKILKDK